jgi:hypothetical protein
MNPFFRLQRTICSLMSVLLAFKARACAEECLSFEVDEARL